MMIDATIVRAHQHSADARKKNGPQAIGRSRGGFRERLSGKRPLRVFQFLDLSGNFRLLEVLARNSPGALGAISRADGRPRTIQAGHVLFDKPELACLEMMIDFI
jgi:hypothetical protein